MEPTKEFDSKYRYILVAARRARQLQGGASALVETSSRKACRIAQDEIQAGKVSYVVPEEATKLDTAAAESNES
ncbi:MAG TPA: DNA-directed RNA polymerase subunit omega [Terriglobales bacterium]|nr:DNA-directed RNA polymerase subunit omega [Terriglobales bacterium]